MSALPVLRQVDRLIASQVLGSLLVVWLVLAGFDTVTHFARELGELGTNGYDFSQAVVYIALTVPRRACDMFPHAALIGSLIGLGNLAATSELTALRASGMSRLRIMLSVLAAVAVLTIGVVALGETVAPAGEQRAQGVKLALRSSELKLTTRSGLWARDGDSIVNAKAARARQVDGRPAVQLVEVRIFEIDDSGMLHGLTRAGMARSDAGHGWQLEDVAVTRLDESGAKTSHHASLPWSSRLDPRLLELSLVNPAYMSLRDLGRNIRYFRANGQNPRGYSNAWWARVFQPLNVLLLVLAALPFAFGNLRSGGLGKRIFLGVILAIAWYFLQLAVVSIANVNDLPPWLANLLPALLLAVLVVLHYRRSARG